MVDGRRHADGSAELHQNPASTVHCPLQPSPLSVLLSSQVSLFRGWVMPSPQRSGRHADGSAELHPNPASTVHCPLQPSPLLVLPSSQVSTAPQDRPSPQTGESGIWVTETPPSLCHEPPTAVVHVPLAGGVAAVLEM